MTKNMGSIDRLLRFAIAVIVAVLYFTGRIDGVAAAILGVVSVIFLLTSLVGTCPLYSIFGLSTCKSA